jgi:hypothetical protein
MPVGQYIVRSERCASLLSHDPYQILKTLDALVELLVRDMSGRGRSAFLRVSQCSGCGRYQVLSRASGMATTRQSIAVDGVTTNASSGTIGARFQLIALHLALSTEIAA